MDNIMTHILLIDWCSHFIVPELGPDVKFSYASHKAVNEYKEAKAVSFLASIPISYFCRFLFNFPSLCDKGCNNMLENLNVNFYYLLQLRALNVHKLF